jgi:acetyl-CoA carboxylase beta subunit
MANIKQTRRQSKTKSKSKTRAKSPETEFDKTRARLDKKKQDRRFKTHWAHFWDVCPKCGGDMFEQTSLDVRYEVCRKCHGIYIDQAEAALADKHLDLKKWLRALLRRSKDPKTS